MEGILQLGFQLESLGQDWAKTVLWSLSTMLHLGCTNLNPV